MLHFPRRGISKLYELYGLFISIDHLQDILGVTSLPTMLHTMDSCQYFACRAPACRSEIELLSEIGGKWKDKNGKVVGMRSCTFVDSHDRCQQGSIFDFE